MTIKTTTWSPDTCGCTLSYKWDDTLPIDQITTMIDIVNKSCNAHKNLLPNVAVTYSCILDENQKKNNTLQIALDNATSKLGDVFVGEDGGTYTVLKGSIAFVYRFEGISPNRVLYISFVGANLTQNEKNQIQTKLNNKFGTGIVIIE